MVSIYFTVQSSRNFVFECVWSSWRNKIDNMSTIAPQLVAPILYPQILSFLSLFDCRLSSGRPNFHTYDRMIRTLLNPIPGPKRPFVEDIKPRAHLLFLFQTFHTSLSPLSCFNSRTFLPFKKIPPTNPFSTSCLLDRRCSVPIVARRFLAPTKQLRNKGKPTGKQSYSTPLQHHSSTSQNHRPEGNRAQSAAVQFLHAHSPLPQRPYRFSCNRIHPLRTLLSVRTNQGPADILARAPAVGKPLPIEVQGVVIIPSSTSVDDGGRCLIRLGQLMCFWVWTLTYKVCLLRYLSWFFDCVCATGHDRITGLHFEKCSASRENQHYGFSVSWKAKGLVCATRTLIRCIRKLLPSIWQLVLHFMQTKL